MLPRHAHLHAPTAYAPPHAPPADILLPSMPTSLCSARAQPADIILPSMLHQPGCHATPNLHPLGLHQPVLQPHAPPLTTFCQTQQKPVLAINSWRRASFQSKLHLQRGLSDVLRTYLWRQRAHLPTQRSPTAPQGGGRSPARTRSAAKSWSWARPPHGCRRLRASIGAL